jgi:hypothetical protein
MSTQISVAVSSLVADLKPYHGVLQSINDSDHDLKAQPPTLLILRLVSSLL